MEKIIIEGYTYFPCTAIAVSIGDSERQNAIYGVRTDSSDGSCDFIVFGYDFDTLSTEMLKQAGEDSACSSAQCDLDTVEFLDGSKPSEYSFT